MPRYRGTQGQVSPKDYMSGFPEHYMPHPGFMQIPQPDYQENDGLMMENISHLDHQRSIDEIRFAAMELAGRESPDGKVEYDDCLVTEELFQQQIELLREPPTTRQGQRTTNPLVSCPVLPRRVQKLIRA